MGKCYISNPEKEKRMNSRELSKKKVHISTFFPPCILLLILLVIMLDREELRMS
jgi:hypothetical protein